MSEVKIKEKKAVAKKSLANKASSKTEKSAANSTVIVTQIGSPIGRHKSQRETLIGLGLNKMNRTRELVDSPEIRGMIAKVSHLVRVESAE